MNNEPIAVQQQRGKKCCQFPQHQPHQVHCQGRKGPNDKCTASRLHQPSIHGLSVQRSLLRSASSGQCTWVCFICGGPADPPASPCKSASDAETDDTACVPRGHGKSLTWCGCQGRAGTHAIPNRPEPGQGQVPLSLTVVGAEPGWAWPGLNFPPAPRKGARPFSCWLACPAMGQLGRWRRGGAWMLLAVKYQKWSQTPHSHFPTLELPFRDLKHYSQICLPCDST